MLSFKVPQDHRENKKIFFLIRNNSLLEGKKHAGTGILLTEAKRILIVFLLYLLFYLPCLHIKKCKKKKNHQNSGQRKTNNYKSPPSPK